MDPASKANLSAILDALSHLTRGAVTRRALAAASKKRQRLDSPLGGGYPGFLFSGGYPLNRMVLSSWVFDPVYFIHRSSVAPTTCKSSTCLTTCRCLGESAKNRAGSLGESAKNRAGSLGETAFGTGNCLDSHKPVEIGDLRPCGPCVAHGIPESPNRPAEAADGPLRGRERGNPSSLADLD